MAFITSGGVFPPGKDVQRPDDADQPVLACAREMVVRIGLDHLHAARRLDARRSVAGKTRSRRMPLHRRHLQAITVRQPGGREAVAGANIHGAVASLQVDMGQRPLEVIQGVRVADLVPAIA
jgi:hypothetical protein